MASSPASLPTQQRSQSSSSPPSSSSRLRRRRRKRGGGGSRSGPGPSSSPPGRRGREYRVPPAFTVDLDAPPDKRWGAVADAYRSTIPKLMKQTWKLLGLRRDEVQGLAEHATFTVEEMLGAVDRKDILLEMKAFASACGLQYGELAALNMSYEMHAACTAIVAPTNGSGGVCLARTLDWDLSPLVDITINVTFVREGKVLYRGTTWAGYLGMLTAVHITGDFALAVNFREEPTPSECVPLDQKSRSAWPVGILARDVLETISSYSEASKRLQRAPLLSPAYFILAGTENRGCVITRDPQGVCPAMELLSSSLEGTETKEMLPPSKETATCSKEKGSERRKSRKSRKSRGKPSAPVSACGSWDERNILVQANMDNWTRDPRRDTQMSLVRLKEARKLLFQSHASKSEGPRPSATKVSRWDETCLWKTLNTYPIWEEGYSIYGTIMFPSTGRLETRIFSPDPSAPKKKGAKTSRKRRGNSNVFNLKH